MVSQFYRSPAKLNLFLEVLGRRPDGFHELETVMVRTSFCDLIRIERSDVPTTTLDVIGSQHLTNHVPLDESNLILKAAAAFRQATGLAQHWTIQLEKHIPMEAGLAGGSSNAATTLRALNDVSGQPLQEQQLHELAAGLGSDINFFVADCEAAVCTGRGEVVTPVQSHGQFHFVVARPASGNSTPAVFKQLQLPEQRQEVKDVVRALQTGSVSDLQSAVFNRLTIPARELNLEMSQLLHNMENASRRPAAMSGSGSTCFVCCHDEADAEQTLRRVQALEPQFAMAVKTE